MFLLCSWCPSLVFPSPSLHESFCSDWLIAGSIFTSPCFYSTTPLFLKKKLQLPWQMLFVFCSVAASRLFSLPAVLPFLSAQLSRLRPPDVLRLAHLSRSPDSHIHLSHLMYSAQNHKPPVYLRWFECGGHEGQNTMTSQNDTCLPWQRVKVISCFSCELLSDSVVILKVCFHTCCVL